MLFGAPTLSHSVFAPLSAPSALKSTGGDGFFLSQTLRALGLSVIFAVRMTQSWSLLSFSPSFSERAVTVC